MKVTKFFVASLAAAALFSCTKESKLVPETTINPEDARVEVSIGKPITTYATSAAEMLVNNSMYALYNKTTGAKITIKPVANTPITKIDFAVDPVIVDNNPSAVLVVIANTVGFTSNGTAAIAMPATLDLARAMTIQGAISNVEAALPNGLPSSQMYDVTLKKGETVKLTEKLLRAASRIYVKANGTNDYTLIENYTIAYTGAASTNLVTRMAAAAAAKSAAIIYKVKKAVDAGSTTQAIGYVYPSTMTQGGFTVTSADKAQTLSVPFTAEANMNYAVNIITKKDAAGNVTFDVEIDSWGNGTDTNVDLGGAVTPPVDSTVLNFQAISPLAIGIPTICSEAKVSDAMNATIELFPGQVGLIKLTIPKGHTLSSKGIPAIEVKPDGMVFVNPGVASAWSEKLYVQKDDVDKGVITFTRKEVTEVNFEKLNIFQSYVTSGFLTKVDITASNRATITAATNKAGTFSLAIPVGFTFKLISATGVNPVAPTTNDWVTMADGKPRLENRARYDSVRSVFGIFNGVDELARFTMIRPAMTFAFSENGAAGISGTETGGSATFFTYVSKAPTASVINVTSRSLFNAIGEGRLLFNNSDITAELAITEGTPNWMIIDYENRHRVDIAPTATVTKCVAVFTYKSKIGGITLGTSTWTRNL